MLYERWSRIAAARRDKFALRDAASGLRWTFGELFDAGERAVVPIHTGLVHPQGHGAEFIITLLCGWRERKIAFPLEPGASGRSNPLTPTLSPLRRGEGVGDSVRMRPLEPGHSAPPIPTPPSWCVHLKLTSATTGASRAVAFTAAQLAADAENIVATMGLRADWPNLGVISMAHSYGFSNLVLPLLLYGIPLILVPSALPEMLKRAAADENNVTLAAVPTLWRAWHEADSIPANVRMAISAGAPLALELERAVFSSRGLKIHNFYGSSECGGIAYDTSATPRTDEACVGAPMHGVNLSANDAGCLIVRSGAVGESYWPAPETTLGAAHFETSDLAELKDGLVFWRGRASEIINVAGRKVSPLTIEGTLTNHPQVRACLVFGVPALDPGRTEDVVACVVADGVVTPESLRDFLSARIAPWQMPRDWWFVDSLQPTRLGKVSRAAWRQKYLERAATGNQTQTT